MRFPRIRFSIQGMLIGIAISTVFTYCVAVPVWNYYRLPFATRQILNKLRQPISIAPTGSPLTLADVFLQVEDASKGPGDKGIPIYVEPLGLQHADRTMASPVAVVTERRPSKEHLERAISSLGMDYYIKDGLLTITSANLARQVLQDPAQAATHP